MATRATADTDARLRELFSEQFARTMALAAPLGAEDPEDTAQEGFARLYANLPRLRDDQAAVSYLRVTVVNLTRTGLARAAMKRRILASRRPAPPIVSAEDRAVADVLDADVAAALDQLTGRQREAVVLRYWLDLSIAEVAAAMKVPLGTAKSHLSRALAALRSALDEQGAAPHV